MNNCNHKTRREEWVTINCFGEETVGQWETWEEPTTIDLDIHRYKCTVCNEIMYYSNSARQYYEEGVKNYVIGLDI